MMNGTKKLQNVPAARKDALISKNLLKSFGTHFSELDNVELYFDLNVHFEAN